MGSYQNCGKVLGRFEKPHKWSWQGVENRTECVWVFIFKIKQNKQISFFVATKQEIIPVRGKRRRIKEIINV